MYERLAAHERRRAKEGLAVAARLGLLHEGEHPRVRPGRLDIGRLVAAAHDHADRLDARGSHLLDDDLQGGLFLPIEVDESLQGQAVLARSGGRDHGLVDFHAEVAPMRAVDKNSCSRQCTAKCGR